MPHKITKGRPGRPANFLVDSEAMSSDTSLNAELGNVTPGTLAHTVGFADYKEKGLDNSWATVVTRGKGTPTTVTGVAPLLLAAALGKPLKSLMQYGLCTTVDGDIFCNNGKLTAVDDELPAGYKRLTGISFDGDIYYETGEALTGEDDVTMTLDNTASQGQNVFGSYNGTSSGSKNFSLFIYGNGSTTNSYFRYGEQLLRPRFGTGERTITFGKSGTDGFATDASATPNTFTTPANAYIGRLPNSTSPAYTGDIIGNILVGTRLKWIPCERESDNAIGYYEAVKGNFIAPTGSGEPVSLGYDTSHLTVLSVVGTPETLTVGKNLFSQDSYLDAYCSAGGTIAAHNSSRCFVLECKPSTEYRFIFDNSAIASPRCVINGFAAQPKIGMRGTQVCYSSSNTAAQLHDTTFTTDADVHYLVMWLIYQKADADTKAAVNNAVLMETATLQTASVANLFAVDDYKDEVDVISGTVTRRTEVSVTGGVITISALAAPVTESVTPQPLSTAEGDNIVSVTANVSPIQLSAVYVKKKG